MQNLTYARNSRVVDRIVDSQLFLLDDHSGRIHALDGAAAGIWNLLERPHSMSAMLEIFRAAFPHETPKNIRSILCKALNELQRKRLVEVA